MATKCPPAECNLTNAKSVGLGKCFTHDAKSFRLYIIFRGNKIRAVKECIGASSSP
jgi:hypothetical protein